MHLSKICRRCDFYCIADDTPFPICILDKHFDVLWLDHCDSFSKSDEAFQKELEEKPW